jgi:hypothetical protein
MPMPTLELIGDHMEEINFPLHAWHTTLHIHEPAKYYKRKEEASVCVDL